ncbi:Hypothetical predicted protein [Lecanosticta acicola]|uniref:Lipase B n=1 Tax=Lecanosticta acicola TaxID=111012 RepID=A0AAI8YVQ6_9PEZI|nr:Hypothetical predicted protein [Lecanosticta acicola]
MPGFLKALALGSGLVASTLATPTPIQVEREAVTPAPTLQERAAAISNQAELDNAASSFSADFASVLAAASVGEAIFTNIVPAPGPTAIPQLQQELQTIAEANPNDLFKSGMEILLNGLAGGDYADIIQAYAVENNQDNVNPIPAPGIYPKKESDDAPYDLSEQQLRQIIYIPPDFGYGKNGLMPVLFLPGTGAVAGSNFGPNYGKLLKAQGVADPVYVNFPGENLADIQVAAEYTAYAINYISAISGGKNVSTISWSAGSLDGQWALKYWPSTRKVLSNKIGISPDYHGTIEAQPLCPGFPTPGSVPAVCQQQYNSTFIRTLRNHGGDSAYVPTTNIYSIFDEIVEPQQDPNASGALLDARGVGVSNFELQAVCSALLPGGSFYNSHEGVLYNALGYALAVDALQNGGPGQLGRVDALYQCEQFATPGLSPADVFATEALIPEAVVAILAFVPKVAMEPPIKAYAQKDVPQ